MYIGEFKKEKKKKQPLGKAHQTQDSNTSHGKHFDETKKQNTEMNGSWGFYKVLQTWSLEPQVYKQTDWL